MDSSPQAPTCQFSIHPGGLIRKIRKPAKNIPANMPNVQPCDGQR